MTVRELNRALAAATAAAHGAGQLMQAHLRRTKKVNEITRHDIKLDLDVRCQRLVTRSLAAAFPDIPVLGEEGVDAAVAGAPARWVVDPIDGTVNYAHGIPHAAVSIALQLRETPRTAGYADGYASVVGVVHEPFSGECFTGVRGGPSRLNGRPISVSRRTLDQAIISLGFSGRAGSIEAMIDEVRRLSARVRKLRMMGSAALALVYVADGRFDAYVEKGVRLWDIAAGGLIVECAGGEFRRQELPGDGGFALTASNGRVRRSLERGA